MILAGVLLGLVLVAVRLFATPTPCPVCGLPMIVGTNTIHCSRNGEIAHGCVIVHYLKTTTNDAQLTLDWRHPTPKESS